MVRGESTEASFQVTVPNRNPEYCGSSPDPLVMKAGETTNVAICFNDPDGHVLSYSAVSSTDAVTVNATAREVRVEATGRHKAEITITAMDTEGGSTSITIDVDVPNHPPTFCEPVPPTIGIGVDERHVLSFCIADLDGDDLVDMLSVSGDAALVLLNDKKDLLTITGVSVGEIAIEYRVTDPYDGEAMARIRVTVTDSEISFEDSFDANSGQWETALSDKGSPAGSFTIKDGILEAWWEEEGPHGRGGAGREVSVEDWRFQTRARTQGPETAVWVELWDTDGQRAYQAWFAPGLHIMNFNLCEYSSDAGFCVWQKARTVALWRVGLGEWFEIEISVQTGEAVFLLDGVEQFRISQPDDVLSRITRVSLKGGLLDHSERHEPAEYDYVRLRGKES